MRNGAWQIAIERQRGVVVFNAPPLFEWVEKYARRKTYEPTAITANQFE